MEAAEDISGPSETSATCSISELRLANEELRQRLALLTEVERQVVDLNSEVEDSQQEIIFRLAEIVEVRSRETGCHVMCVAELSHLLALKAGLSESDAELVRAAAPMHDVGKVAIPDSILFNPGRLSAEEFEVMKTHTTIGGEMLDGSKRAILRNASVIALQHHEKFNGTGYPLGLKGRQIHLLARIVAIADVFDALGSDRVYRKAWDMQRILAYFKRQRGQSFDPDLLDLLLEHVDDFLAVRQSFLTAAGTRQVPSEHVTRRRPPADDCQPPVISGQAGSIGASGPSAQEDARRTQPVGRILVADDDPASRSVLEAAFDQWGYDVTVCQNPDEVKAVMQDADYPRLAIVSHAMDDRNGLDVCRMIRRRDGEYVYVILLGEEGRRDQAAAGMAAGADACLFKPVQEQELRARLGAAERILGLQEQLLTTHRSLEIQATHDALTDLWNRRAILRILQGELDRARREDISIAVIMADLDRFKLINDTYGHQAGDVALREASERMRRVTRPYDMVGRYGGEEFIIVVPRCDITFATYVAERVRLAVASEPICINGQEVPLTASFGVTACRGVEDTDADALVRAADAALYRAKREGRNRVCAAEGNLAGV